MSLGAVRQLLAGWKDHPVRLGGGAANPVHLWDFTPPEGSDRQAIRLTFDNNGLVVWGAPGDRFSGGGPLTIRPAPSSASGSAVSAGCDTFN